MTNKDKSNQRGVTFSLGNISFSQQKRQRGPCKHAALDLALQPVKTNNITRQVIGTTCQGNASHFRI